MICSAAPIDVFIQHMENVVKKQVTHLELLPTNFIYVIYITAGKASDTCLFIQGGKRVISESTSSAWVNKCTVH